MAHARASMASSREIVLISTSYDRATSANVSPAARRLSASCRWNGVSFGLRPNSHTARHGALTTGASALTDQLALELGKAR